MKVAIFSTKSYDRQSFTAANTQYQPRSRLGMIRHAESARSRKRKAQARGNG
jgi:hypothetical protein